METSLAQHIAESDMERVGDHAENIVELAEEMRSRRGISLLRYDGLEELNEMSTTTLAAVITMRAKALELDDITCANKDSSPEDQGLMRWKSCAQGISSVCPMRRA